MYLIPFFNRYLCCRPSMIKFKHVQISRNDFRYFEFFSCWRVLNLFFMQSYGSPFLTLNKKGNYKVRTVGYKLANPRNKVIIANLWVNIWVAIYITQWPSDFITATVSLCLTLRRKSQNCEFAFHFWCVLTFSIFFCQKKCILKTSKPGQMIKSNIHFHKK